MNDEFDPLAHVLISSALNVSIVVGWLLDPSQMTVDLLKIKSTKDFNYELSTPKKSQFKQVCCMLALTVQFISLQ